MWVKATDGHDTVYFPMANSKIRYEGQNGALGYCQLEQGSYALDSNGNEMGTSSKFRFQDAEIIEYTDLP